MVLRASFTRQKYFVDSHACREHFEYLWSEMDSEWQSYDRFRENRSFIWQSWCAAPKFSRHAFWCAAPKFCVLYSGDIISTYILTDAWNALRLLAVTHVNYGIRHDKNKENQAYRRLIFLNLQPNGIPRIIEHVQNATFFFTRQSNVYTHHNLLDFLPK